MKRNYQGVVNRIKTVALAHPQINSADDGRELEFDVNKNNTWPRFFMKTINSPLVGGQGTVEISVGFEFLLMDRMKANRDNVIDVMNLCHSAMTDVLAVLNKEQLIYIADNPIMTPLYDYQDTQTSGWKIPVRVYLDQGFKCYTVP